VVGCETQGAPETRWCCKRWAAFASPRCAADRGRERVWDLVSIADMPGEQVTLPNPASVSLPQTRSGGTWLPW